MKHSYLMMLFAIWSPACLVSSKHQGHRINTSQEISTAESVSQGSLAFGGVSSAFLDKNGVDAMIREGIPMIGACYEQEIRCPLSKKPEGTIVVRFTITAEGDITAVGIEETTMNTEKMEACLIEVFQGFRYHHATGATFVISYPLRFQLEHPQKNRIISKLER